MIKNKTTDLEITSLQITTNEGLEETLFYEGLEKGFHCSNDRLNCKEESRCGIASLSDEVFEPEFIRKGYIEGKILAEEYDPDEMKPGLNLVFDLDFFSEHIIDTKEPESLEPFLKRMFFGIYYPFCNWLTLPSRMSLYEILLNNKDRIKEKGLPLFREALPALKRTSLDEKTINAIENAKMFSSRFLNCSCGDPICTSEYLWIEDNICMFHFAVSGSYLCFARLFPFRTEGTETNGSATVNH